MTKYVQGKDGRFAGSIGSGKAQLPTASDIPSATDAPALTETVASHAEQRTRMLERLREFEALQERTVNEIQTRAIKYQARTLFQGTLTNHEVDLLRSAARANPGFGEGSHHQEKFEAALVHARQDPRIGAVVRAVYFTEDGALRSDVGTQASYTADTVVMTVETELAAMEEPELCRWVGAIHGMTEYINDRERANGEMALTYPNEGTYPDLEWLRGGPGSVTVDGLSPEQETTAARKRVAEALAYGYWGPNAG